MAIVSVLWAIGLLAAIAVSLVWNGTIAYRLAHNDFELAASKATAEAGINRAILSLLDSQHERRWRTDGVASTFEFGATRIKVSIQDELGRIDLNQAEGSLLNGLLRSTGLDPQSADVLTDKILDWRETSPFKRLNGAKESDYRAAGFFYRPRGGLFRNVNELLLVMGMTPDLFRRIEPALTVYSGRQYIDPQLAPREALLALPSMDGNKVDAVMAARVNWQAAVPSLEETIPLQGRAFTIRAELERSNGSFVQQAVIRLTGNPSQPYWILSWKS
jgi:general secretion pathway protein K